MECNFVQKRRFCTRKNNKQTNIYIKTTTYIVQIDKTSKDNFILQLKFLVLGWFNLLAALGITVWLATWVRQLYQGNCLQGQNPRQSPALDL